MQDMFDNMMLSAASLRDLWRAHHNDLSQIPIHDTSRINKYRDVLAQYKEAALKNQESTENKQNVINFLL
jgi:hypothetical protein